LKVDEGKGPADFKIFVWCTNVAKSDLSYEDFLELYKKVVSVANKANSADAKSHVAD